MSLPVGFACGVGRGSLQIPMATGRIALSVMRRLSVIDTEVRSVCLPCLPLSHHRTSFDIIGPQEEELKDAILLVFANKQDSKGALNAQQVQPPPLTPAVVSRTCPSLVSLVHTSWLSNASTYQRINASTIDTNSCYTQTHSPHSHLSPHPAPLLLPPLPGV